MPAEAQRTPATGPPPSADGCVWLTVAGAARGRIIPRVAAALDRLTALFEQTAGGFSLRDAGMSAPERSALLQESACRLREAGLVPGWRNERCSLLAADGAEIARFERGAFRTLGLQNRAVHVNGCLPDGTLWIARRSARKTSAPGKLDNMAAGAIAAGETQQSCAVRELWEEAGVPAELSAAVTFTGGELRSLRPLEYGYHDEVIACADLLLPDGFQPRCQDGEVDEFLRMSTAEARAALAAGEFSIEAGAVLADWLERHTHGRAP